MKFVQHFLIFCFLFLISYSALAQPFSHADSLRGSNGPFRDWWKVLHYDITIKPNHFRKTIEGVTTITFKALKEGSFMQIDLQDPLIIDSAIFHIVTNNYIDNQQHSLTIATPKALVPVIFKKDGNTYNYNLGMPCNANTATITHSYNVTIYYHGKPREAVKPPWDGGVVWTKDKNNYPWISTACQDLGASAWFPCKDIQSDEPDSGATIHLIVPDDLVGVSNGRMTESKSLDDGTTAYT